MIAVLLAFVVGTWNGNWFPAGRSEYRAEPAVEAARIRAAGHCLAEGLKAVDPAGTNDVVLVLNEMRDEAVVQKLLESVGRKNLKIAAMTKYRLGDKADEQQDVVATTLPVVKSRWARWRYDPNGNPPRGYAFASVVVEPAVTAHVYAVHLKANGGGKDEAVALTNRLKRANAIGQFLKIESKGSVPVLLAGDFNTDCWNAKFADETLFKDLETAGFTNALASLPPKRRRTHVSGMTLDYIMLRATADCGLVAASPLITPSASEFSDHFPVFVNVQPAAAPRGTSRARPCRP